ncbi:hypothetical protein KSW81_006138 [Nannochloris sp. 'desiccata']|nr:hypothetical protein KSW81_006138 [Chlorella desiccata (nom. nud.)]
MNTMHIMFRTYLATVAAATGGADKTKRRDEPSAAAVNITAAAVEATFFAKFTLDAFDQGLQEDGYEDYDAMDINPDRVDLSHDEDPAAGGGSANSQQAIAPLHPQVPPCY